jgi:hypothetical protein
MRTRTEKDVPLDQLPLFSTAFEDPPAPPAAAANGNGGPAAAPAAAAAGGAAGDGALQQQQQVLAGEGDIALAQFLPAKHPVVQQQAEAAARPRLKALTAAALLGGWWGEAEQGTAARQAALAAVRDAVGGEVATCVQMITE